MHDLPLYDAVIYALGPLILGILMLIKGGNWTVDASIHTAQRHGISPMIVGFTIIAFGTSLPELVVSILANYQGAAGIAVGNVIGSNIANVLLVIGVSAIFITLRVRRSSELFRDLVIMLLATVVLSVVVVQGEITRMAGVLMVGSLLTYVFIQCWTSTPDKELIEDSDIHHQYKSELAAWLSLLAGMALVALGAEFMVKGAKLSAELIGVPDAVIGLSIIALGTSLPELSTSIIASKKGHDDMVIGNIVGSNVFNVLMILGFTSLVMPIEQGSFSVQLAQFDVWVALVVAIIFSALLVLFGKITKVTGILFVLTYVAYNIYIYAANMGT